MLLLAQKGNLMYFPKMWSKSSGLYGIIEIFAIVRSTLTRKKFQKLANLVKLVERERDHPRTSSLDMLSVIVPIVLMNGSQIAYLIL